MGYRISPEEDRSTPRTGVSRSASSDSEAGGGDREAGSVLARFTRLAVRLLDVPAAAIALAGDGHECFTNVGDIPAGWQASGLQSLCGEVRSLLKSSGAPLYVDDARDTLTLGVIPSINTLAIAAIAAAPLRSSRGDVVGSLCVVDRVPRSWSEDDRLTLLDLAAAAITEYELRQRSASLRDQEARFRSLIEHTSDIIILVGADDRIEFVSPAIERVLGYRAGDALGRPIFEAVNADDVPRIVDAFRRMHDRAGTPWSIELRARHRDGTWRYLEAVVEDLLDDPNIQGVVITIRDITERKQAEADRAALLHRAEAARTEAEASRARYLDLVQGVDAIVWEADATTFHPTFVSDRAEELLGYPIADWLLGPEFWPRLIHPGDFDRVVMQCREAINRKSNHDLEYRVRTADGRMLWIRDLVRVSNDEEGRPTQLRGVMIDVTEQKRHHEMIEEREARFRSLVQNAMEIIYLIDASASIKYVSPSVERILGFRPEDLLGRSMFDFVHPDDSQPTLATLGDILQDPGGTRLSTARMRAADSSWRWVDGLGTNLLHDPSINGIVVNVRDVTDRIVAEEAIRASEARMRALFKGSPIPSYTWQRTGNDVVLVDFNDAAEAFTHGAIRAHRGRLSSDLLREYPEIRADIERCFQQQSTFKPPHLYTIRGGMPEGEGSAQHLDFTYVYVPSNLVMVHTQDVTERTALEQELRHQAFFDSLTGLPNRALFLDRLGHALAARTRRHTQVAVLFMDLDSFKVVNDNLGHPAGDTLLTAVAKRFSSCMRSSDTLARFGGDEFAVLLEDLGHFTEAIGVAERLLASVRTGVSIDGREVYVTVSIGVVVAGVQDPTNIPDELLRRADVALYQAKAAGKNRYAVYDPAMQNQTSRRTELQSDLSRALERNELVLHYQPELDLASGVIIGVEALVRWQHPHHGLLAPASFIPLAEETGQIAAIDRWVLREACHQLSLWHDTQRNRPPLQLSINLSPRQLGGPSMLDELRQCLQQTGIDPLTLWLELTESTLMDDTIATRELLGGIRSLGVRLALDDFGTGYSSLSYLSRLPVGMLKLDRSFVTALGRDRGAGAVVQAVTVLAHALRMQVTAEGVETAQQLEHLRALGCDWVQGFYIATPLTPTAIDALLTTPFAGPARTGLHSDT